MIRYLFQVLNFKIIITFKAKTLLKKHADDIVRIKKIIYLKIFI